MRFPEYAKFTPANFKLERALVVTKLSRYEFEQLRHPGLSKEQLEQKLRNRGTDVEMVLYLHNLHKDFERRIVQSFQNVGCEVKLASRCVHSSSSFLFPPCVCVCLVARHIIMMQLYIFDPATIDISVIHTLPCPAAVLLCCVDFTKRADLNLEAR